MSKIVGNVVGIPNPQSDWNQSDEKKADYIKNKPNIVEIIRENTQQYINEETTLPPSVQCMVDYVNSMPYGDDIVGLRSELYDNYVSNEDLNNKVAQTERYINHDMRIENLELDHVSRQDFGTTEYKANENEKRIAALENDLDNVESIAKGRATGYVFDTVDDMNAWLADSDNVANLTLGDNLYIRATNVPDYWWDGTQAQELETQKVDLTEYVKNTDYATNTKAGVVKVATSGNTRGIIIAADNILQISCAERSDILGRASYNKPITPVNLEYAVEVCTNQDSEAELTEAQLKLPPSTQFLKDAINNAIGVVLGGAS